MGFRLVFILLFLLVTVIWCFEFVLSGNTLSTKESLFVRSNSTLVSPDKNFELGFFNTAPRGNRWYIGIWYKKIPKRTYVWVANRDTPLSNSNGTLQVSDGSLIIHDPSTNHIIWSKPSVGTQRRSSRSPAVVAELLSNGNLVLRYSNNKDPKHYLWQSFDDPTDTLLPEMTLNSSLKGANYASRRYLKCWTGAEDPTQGEFSLGLTAQEFPRLQILGKEGDTKLYRSGAWNDVVFTGVPLVFNFTRVGEDSVFMYQADNSYSRVTLTPDGTLRVLAWNQTRLEWNMLWYAPSSKCDSYNHCGTNRYCDEYKTPSPMCKCIEGFESQSGELRNVTKGCVRKTTLSCSGNRFDRLPNMKLPDTEGANRYTVNGLKDCEDKCTNDCYCTAFTLTAYQNGSLSQSCLNWKGDLLDVRNYSGAGQDIYVRLNGSKNNKKRNKNMSLIIGLSIGGSITAVIVLGVAAFWLWKRKQNRARENAMSVVTSPEAIHFEAMSVVTSPEAIHFEAMSVVTSPEAMFGGDAVDIHPIDFGLVLKATEHFSNEIGAGGFGKVYKGKFHDGQEIAVKKLSETSKQGIKEFYTEVKLIATLQHINIVRLLGWSTYRDEMVLIYEYLANGSLESHLFGQRSGELNWQVRFDIIKGIARGLAYMEEGSRDIIIHRDLKPSNILLDEDMTPKISDFGLARICKRNGNQSGMTKVAGTHGYMSPEQAVTGIYSRKSDIFSFGVIVLEIVSGKQNRTFSSSTNLPSHVWAKWKEGNWEVTLDPVIRHSSPFPSEQVRRCIEIGLLCVQQVIEDRPNMTLVETMLASQSYEIRHPQQPGFFMGQGQFQDQIPSSSSTYGECSTLTMPR